jgi:IS30 family transposase
MDLYFAHPYSSWKRPTNENTNGIISDCLSSGTDFDFIKKKDTVDIQDQLNQRFRSH